MRPPGDISWRSIFTLSLHLCLRLPNAFLPAVLPTENLYTSANIRMANVNACSYVLMRRIYMRFPMFTFPSDNFTTGLYTL
jgi:hypothetical protein